MNNPNSLLYQPVSFVIPAHNEQDFLGNTLTVLLDSIAQLNLDSEIIVVNDDSTDQTSAIARSHGARIVDVKLRNIGAVRNAGAAEANHNWLFFVDADTEVPVKTLQFSLDALRDGCVGGGARVDLTDELPIPFFKWMMYLLVVVVWQVIGRWAAGCYMFCVKDKFFSFGGFDEKFFAAEELFFSRQLKRLGKFRIIKHPVVTSARKLHRYSVWQLARFMTLPLTTFWAPLQTKKGLEILYKDKR